MKDKELEKLDTLIKDFIECAMYRRVDLQKPIYLEIYPQRAQYLAGLLQELRTLRLKVDTNDTKGDV